MTGPPVPTPRGEAVELAYEAAQRHIAVQDATLGNTRTRAATLLSAAALLATVAVAVGFMNTDPAHGVTVPRVWAWLLFAATALLGGAVLVVLWPVRGWCFGPSAAAILDRIDDAAVREEAKSGEAVRRHITRKLIDGAAGNDRKLALRQHFFRGAVVLFVAEALLLVGMVLSVN